MPRPLHCPEGVHIYPQGAHRCCLICGQRKPFDPADYFDPWPSWDGLKAGDAIEVHHGNSDPWPAVVISTHRFGAQVEVAPPEGAGVDAWIQLVMQRCDDGTYAR